MVSTTSPATFSSACCPAPGIDAGVAAATSPAAPGAGIGAADAEARWVADWREQPPEAVSASTTTEQVRKAILITEPPRRKLTHASLEDMRPGSPGCQREYVVPVESHLGEKRRIPVSYTHLRAHETRHDLVCRLLLEK